MKKLILIAIMASGLVACAQSTAPQEDSRLKEAYSACINTAQGSPEKIEACQSVLKRAEERETTSAFCRPGKCPRTGLSAVSACNANRK